MKLKKVRITNFRSVYDSGTFNVANITCLVGKNEAGKTAVLQALQRLNPLDSTANAFSVIDDFPRAEVSEYEQGVKAGKRKPADVVSAEFELSDGEERAIEKDFGTDVKQWQQYADDVFCGNFRRRRGVQTGSDHRLVWVMGYPSPRQIFRSTN